jgi:hypothetical protein
MNLSVNFLRFAGAAGVPSLRGLGIPFASSSNARETILPDSRRFDGTAPNRLESEKSKER